MYSEDVNISLAFPMAPYEQVAHLLCESFRMRFIKVRFAQNDECLTAYKRLLCWQNFPSCESGNRSVGLCRTACESYHKACLFDTNDGTAAISPSP